MTSPDLPFKLEGGNTETAAMRNRANAIARINHLSGIDLTKKTKWYRFALDMEMYQRWYKNEPKDHKIDEEWCQRAAEVVKSMEKDEGAYDTATELASRVKVVYQEHESLPLKEPEQEKPNVGWLNKIFKKGEKE